MIIFLTLSVPLFQCCFQSAVAVISTISTVSEQLVQLIWKSCCRQSTKEMTSVFGSGAEKFELISPKSNINLSVTCPQHFS